MAERHELLQARIPRRSFFRAAGLGVGAVVAGPILWRTPGASASPATGVHLSYGSDPRSEMAMSWGTPGAIEGATVEIGRDRSYGLALPVDSRTVAGTESIYHHAYAADLRPGKTYRYRITHRGGEIVEGRFRTAPEEPRAFTFRRVRRPGDRRGGRGEHGTARPASPRPPLPRRRPLLRGWWRRYGGILERRPRCLGRMVPGGLPRRVTSAVDAGGGQPRDGNRLRPSGI